MKKIMKRHTKSAPLKTKPAASAESVALDTDGGEMPDPKANRHGHLRKDSRFAFRK